MASIVDKFLKELFGQLKERNVTMEVTAGARDYLAERGYDADFGARPLARVIQDEVKQPLGEELLFGKLERGGSVVLDVEDATVEDPATGERRPGKKLTFACTPSPATEASA